MVENSKLAFDMPRNWQDKIKGTFLGEILEALVLLASLIFLHEAPGGGEVKKEDVVRELREAIDLLKVNVIIKQVFKTAAPILVDVVVNLLNK